MRRASVFSGVAFRSALLFLIVFAVVLGVAGAAILQTTQASMNEQLRSSITEDFDLLSHTAKRGDVVIDLQAKEFTLLEVLMRNAGRIITKTMLLEQVWDFNFDPKTTVVETHMSRLRSKVDKPFDVPLIHTTRNSGYSIHAPR